jgi:hypothetical protein
MKSGEVFESRCNERCQELAARAAEIEKSNVQWWRLRAMLVTRDSWDAKNLIRDPHWLDTLDQCALHDPDNAFYDYLAAYIFLTKSSELDYPPPDFKTIIKITDASEFQRGIDRFERGQNKPFLALPNEAGAISIAEEFLEKSKVPLIEHPNILSEWHVMTLQGNVLAPHYQFGRADEAEANGEYEKAMMLSKQYLHLLDQYSTNNSATDADLWFLGKKVQAYGILKEHAEKHTELLKDGEMKSIVDSLESARLDMKVCLQAMREDSPSPAYRRDLNAAIDLFAEFAPAIILLMLPVVLLMFAVAHRFGKEGVPVVGLFGQTAAFAVALAITYPIFGMAPTRIIPETVQEWSLTLGLFIAPAVLIFWICWRWLRRHSYQFSIRAMLIGTAAFYLLLGALTTLFASVSDFPFRFSVPEIRYGDTDYYQIVQKITSCYGNWGKAVYQWHLYGGLYWTLGIWAMLVAALFYCKNRRRRRLANAEPLGWRKFISGLLRSYARTGGAIVLLLIFAYLLAMPAILERAEKEFQDVMVIVRHRNKCLAELKQKIERVRADEESMALLKAASKVEESPKPENQKSSEPPAENEEQKPVD